MNNVDKITYNIADYNSKDELIDAVLTQMRIFILNKKVFSFYEVQGNKGIYALQFGPMDVIEYESWPVWLNMEEMMYVSSYASQVEYAKAKKTVRDFEDDSPLQIKVNDDKDEDKPKVKVKDDKKTDA